MFIRNRQLLTTLWFYKGLLALLANVFFFVGELSRCPDGAFVLCFPHATGKLSVFRVEHRLQTARIVLHSVAVLSTGIHYLCWLCLCYYASRDGACVVPLNTFLRRSITQAQLAEFSNDLNI